MADASARRAAARGVRAAGVDVAAGERAVELMRGARRVDPAARRSSAASAGSAARSRSRPATASRCSSPRPTASARRPRSPRALGRFDTIGIDLVAMCADDVVCTRRRAARLPRLRRRRPARPERRRRARRRRRGRLPRGRLRARRRRDGRAPGPDGARTRSTSPGCCIGVVERDDAHRRDARSRAGDAIVGLAVVRAPRERLLARPRARRPVGPRPRASRTRRACGGRSATPRRDAALAAEPARRRWRRSARCC